MELTVDEALKKGVEAHQDGKAQEADRYYTAILQAQPKHPDANHNMGILAVSVGKVEAALPFLKTALDSNPNIAQFWLSYINALIKLDRLDDAKAVFDQAKSNGAKGDGFDQIERRLNNASVSVRKETQEDMQTQPNILDELKLDKAIKLAEKKVRNGLPEEAKKIYKDILEKFPKNKKALHGIKTLASKTLANKSGMGEPPSDQFQSVLNLYTQGQYQKALNRCSELLEQFPNSINLYNIIGAANQELGKAEKAIAAYKKAISIKPDFVEAFYNMGIALKEQGKLEEAIEAFTKALSIKPDNPEATNNLAFLLFESGKFEKAAKLFSMNDSIKNQSFLLKCFYELDNKSKFYDQLDYLIKRGENNCMIGSYACRATIRYGTYRENPFCNDPLKYIKKINLSEKCDFKKTFVENAANVLSNDEITHKSQRLLKNGIQTSGNIFKQVGSVTNLWQDVIRDELTNYKDHFRDSEEGLIQDWPSNYSLNGWLLSMKNGGEISAHIHEAGWVSGSIYINVPPKLKKDSGNLVVTSQDARDGKRNSKNTQSIDVVTGSLCLFPSSLLHYTIPFESNEDRIVLAFDMIPNK